MTAALEGGEWSASRPGRIFTPRKDVVPIVKEAGWAPRPVWTGAENLDPTGIRSRTVQPVASRYTDWATWPTITWMYKCKLHYLYLFNNIPHSTQTVYSTIVISLPNSPWGWFLQTVASSRIQKHYNMNVKSCHYRRLVIWLQQTALIINSDTTHVTGGSKTSGPCAWVAFHTFFNTAGPATDQQLTPHNTPEVSN